MATKIIKEKTKAMNRHWKNFIDKNYLGSHNLEDGEEMLLTIEKFVGEETVKTADGDKNAQVIYFKENVPKMIMNITNGNTISQLYGSHPDQWAGKQIQLYAAKVKAFGKTQDALRIRDFVPTINVDTKNAIAAMRACKTLAQLQAVFSKLPRSAMTNVEIVKVKDELKVKLAPKA